MAVRTTSTRVLRYIQVDTNLVSTADIDDAIAIANNFINEHPEYTEYSETYLADLETVRAALMLAIKNPQLSAQSAQGASDSYLVKDLEKMFENMDYKGVFSVDLKISWLGTEFED